MGRALLLFVMTGLLACSPSHNASPIGPVGSISLKEHYGSMGIGGASLLSQQERGVGGKPSDGLETQEQLPAGDEGKDEDRPDGGHSEVSKTHGGLHHRTSPGGAGAASGEEYSMNGPPPPPPSLEMIENQRMMQVMMKHISWLYPRVLNVTRHPHTSPLPLVGPIGQASHALRLRHAIEESENGRVLAVRRYDSERGDARHALWELVSGSGGQGGGAGGGIGDTLSSSSSSSGSSMNGSESIVRITPLQPVGREGSWDLRLVNVTRGEWDASFAPPRRALIQGGDTAGDPFLEGLTTFEGLVGEAGSLFRLGWPVEASQDDRLVEHMAESSYAVDRERSSYDLLMDRRAFNRILAMTAEAAKDGEAGFMDARRIVDRMFVAGLHPDWASVSSLLDTVSQDSRNGTCMIWQIDQVLDLMVQAKLPPQNWHYRVACEALAWCCARGTAELADLLQFLDRMAHDLVDQSGASGVATVNVMGHVLPHDSDLISSVLLVLAGISHAPKLPAEEGTMTADPGADEVMRLSAEILISMREAGVERTGLTYACLLEILAGIGHRGGAVGVEDCEVVFAWMEHDMVGVAHQHIRSLLSIISSLSERGDTYGSANVSRAMGYLRYSGLVPDGGCFSLALRTVLMDVERGDSSFGAALQLLVQMEREGVGGDQPFWTSLFRSFRGWYIRGVIDKAALGLVVEHALVMGGVPDKETYHLLLLAEVEVAEARAKQHSRSAESLQSSSSSSSSSSVLAPSPHHAALGTNAPPGAIVTPVSLETVLHDMVVAGHDPDSSSVALLMRGLKACAILGTAATEDAERCLERAVTAGVRLDGAAVEDLLSVALSSSIQGLVGLSDCIRMVARAAEVAGGGGLVSDPRVLSLLIRIASSSASFGLASACDAIGIAQDLMKHGGEEGKALSCAEMENVLVGCSLHGLVTMQEAELIIQSFVSKGVDAKPSRECLRALLDSCVSDSREGLTTFVDAERVLGRIRGCGYEPSVLEHQSVFTSACWSSQYGVGTFLDARRLFDTIKKAGGAVTTDEYYGMLEAAAWYAYWQQQRSPGGAGPQDATGSGNQPTWSSELWEGVDSILGEMEGQGLELGCWCVTMCSRIARYCRVNDAVVRSWQLFRSVPPRSRSPEMYSEMISALGAVGNDDAAVGLLDVASKHGLRPTGEMYSAAIMAATTRESIKTLGTSARMAGVTLSAEATGVLSRGGRLESEASK